MRPEHAKAFVEPFVRQHWRALAATAWEHYLREGRGALAVEWSAVRRWVKGAPTALAPKYVTAVATRGLPTMLQSYDPKTSVVMLFLSDEPGIADCAWTFTEPPPPPDAYESRGR